MRGQSLLTCGAIVAAGLALFAQTREPSTMVFEGARLIIGDATAPIENGAIVVQGGRIVSVGRAGQMKAPTSAARVDVRGKTIMPAMVNAHVHIGYEGYTSWGAANYTPQNVLDH